MRVLIFGDSIAYGKYDSQGGWADRLKTFFLDQQIQYPDKDPPSVYNLGIEGETTKHLATRLPHEIVARRNLWENDTDFVFVFATGVNDSLISEKGEFFSHPSRFAKDLRELYEVAKLFSEKMLFVGLTPVEDDNPSNQFYKTDRIWRFERVLREFVQAYSLPFVALFEEFQKCISEELLFANGLHPNDEGHRLIYELVSGQLNELL